jgi:SAM-dependent methyltransferase
MSNDRVQSYYWDSVRDTTVGRYLSQREYAFISSIVRAGAQPRRMLDVGCGSGRMTLPLHAAGLDVIGLDIDPVALAAFQRRSAAISLVRGSTLDLPFAANSFDCVICIQSFDYFDHRQFLRELGRVLDTGGLLIFDMLNRRSYKWPLKRLMGRTLDLPSAALNYHEVLGSMVDHGFDLQGVSGYNWIPFGRDSDSAFVGPVAVVEQMLRLDRCYGISPKILVAARKKKRSSIWV